MQYISILLKSIKSISIKCLLFLTVFQFCNPIAAQETKKVTSLNKNYINLVRAESSADSKFFIDRIRVTGNTVFTKSEIDSLTVPFLKKNLSYEQLKQIAKMITDLYVEKGYVTSGAFFPEQEIIDGVVVVRIIEGKLEKIEVEGLDNKAEIHVKNRLKPNFKSPLNIQKIQEDVQLLGQDPLIKNIEAELVVGSGLGKSKLQLDIQQESPWAGNLVFNNHNSANSGEFQLAAIVANQNLLGFRDQLEFGYSLTEGFDSLSFDYALPLNAQGSKLRARYSEGDSEIIDNDFSDFGIRADASSLSLQFEQPVVSDLNREVAVFLALDSRDSNTFIEDDLPFSFTDGAEEGSSRITALRIGSLWTERSKTTVLSVSNRFNIGLDLLDATINENATDGRFFSWLGQVQFLKALNKKQNTLLVTRLTTQLTPDSLLSSEQIAIGGVDTVRGYRENREVGDNSVFGTIEVQLPIIQDSQVGNINLVPFFDAGAVWDTEGDEAETLASLGLGFDWEVTRWLTVDFDWGIPLVSTDDFDSSVQDKGLHFQLQVSPQL